jgi:hypothetical protein
MSKVSLEKICNGGDELRHLERSLVNIGTEIEEHHLDDSNIFNQLTSGESIDAALKYERSRTIKPSCKHIFIGNHPPRWKRGSDAQARRIDMVYLLMISRLRPKMPSLKPKSKLRAAAS